MKRTKSGEVNKQSHAHTDAMNVHYAMSPPTLLALFAHHAATSELFLTTRVVEFNAYHPGSNLGIVLAELEKFRAWCRANGAGSIEGG